MSPIRAVRLCSLFLLALSGVSTVSADSSSVIDIGVSIGTGAHSGVASGWFAGWHANLGFPVSEISWSKYTQLTYAFAETTPDVNVLSLNGSNPDVLPHFVAAAHAHNVKALISIGGWTGSRWWSSNVGSAENRTAFVKTVTNFARKYNLDGLDFDWEYPGNQGLGCNVVDPADSANFLSFIQELRADKYGASLILTAATATAPFIGPDHTPLADVSGFSKVLNYIALMNYDIWGHWSATVGPNAPLDDTCAAPAHNASSAVSAVKAWTAAGIPVNQLILGVPAYGHSFSVPKANAFANGSTTLSLYPAFNTSVYPVGDAWDDASGFDPCGAVQNPGGNVNFWGLISQGYLTKEGKPEKGIAYVYDKCSQTPYVYNQQTEIMVSFDNAQSFSAKGGFIKANKLAGFSMWEIGGDYNDILLDSIRKSAGYGGWSIFG